MALTVGQLVEVGVALFFIESKKILGGGNGSKP